MTMMKSTLLAVAAASAMIGLFAHAATEPVTSGGLFDYQPSVIRSSDDGARIVVFERLNPGTQFGDLWVTRSTDGGSSWSTPAIAIGSASNERHPALLQTGPARYVLFYLKGTGIASSFRIARATSSDGIGFVEQGTLDLGWATGGEINPHVIDHGGGVLTMSYQRLGSGSYVAQSLDNGISWDLLKTPIALGSQLPRIAWRPSDGRYVASYQTGSTALNLYVKTTNNLRDWSAPPLDFAIGGNHHDSVPVLMPDDGFVLTWIRANGSGFDIALRRSGDGRRWSATQAVTTTPTENDVQPHPLVDTSAGSIELYWGREIPYQSGAFNIVRDANVVIDAIHDSGFDSPP